MKYITSTMLFLMLSLGAFTQDYESISSAFGRGSVSDLAAFFDSSLEITVSRNIEDLDRNKAQEKLRNFFRENEPTQFRIVHKGVSPSDLHYCIGELTANTGTFRITLYLKKSGDKYLMQSMEIEKE